MGLFPPSFGFLYILVVIVMFQNELKILCLHNDHKTVIYFLKENLLSKFGISQAIISNGGKYFSNKSFKSLMKKYGITYKGTTPYRH